MQGTDLISIVCATYIFILRHVKGINRFNWNYVVFRSALELPVVPALYIVITSSKTKERILPYSVLFETKQRYFF